MTLTKCVFPCWETPLKCYIRNSECHNKKLGRNGGETVCITDKNTSNEQWYILPINKAVDVNNNENNDEVEIMCRIITSCDKSCRLLVLNNESEMTKRLYTCTGDKVKGDTDIWILRKSSLHNEFTLKASDLYLGCDNKTWLTSTCDELDENKLSYQWKLEVLTGELCYIKSKCWNKFVSCNSKGKLIMNQTYSPTEVWRFIEVGDTHNSVLIASWTPLPSKVNAKYIILKSDGVVETTEDYASVFASNCARWVLQKSKCGTGINLRPLLYSEKYLSIKKDGTFYVTKKFTGESVWQTGPAHENKFHISSCSSNIRVSCDASGSIKGSNNRDKSTSWTVVADVESNTIYIQHIETKKWLGVTSNEKGDERPEPCLLNDKQQNTEWFIGLASDNGSVIVSCQHSMWCLAYNGSFYMTASDHEHARWYLEPIMPVADKGFNIMRIVIAGTVSAVAAPYLFTAAVSVIGFTSVGVAGGSYAASMMSAAAIANGGGVAAGSTVAILQSAGYGLGVYGTTIAAGSGAIVGGTLAGATTMVTSGMSQQHDQNETVTSTSDEVAVVSPQIIQNRPICSWQFW